MFVSWVGERLVFGCVCVCVLLRSWLWDALHPEAAGRTERRLWRVAESHVSDCASMQSSARSLQLRSVSVPRTVRSPWIHRVCVCSPAEPTQITARRRSWRARFGPTVNSWTCGGLQTSQETSLKVNPLRCRLVSQDEKKQRATNQAKLFSVSEFSWSKSQVSFSHRQELGSQAASGLETSITETKFCWLHC